VNLAVAFWGLGFGFFCIKAENLAVLRLGLGSVQRLGFLVWYSVWGLGFFVHKQSRFRRNGRWSFITELLADGFVGCRSKTNTQSEILRSARFAFESVVGRDSNWCEQLLLSAKAHN
jgi:hypothetical protein